MFTVAHSGPQLDLIKSPSVCPKTPNVQYDAHPLVAVSDIFQWGFRGINFHWGQSRQYTWQEIVGSLHVVNSDELQDLISIPYGKIGLNN